MNSQISSVVTLTCTTMSLIFATAVTTAAEPAKPQVATPQITKLEIIPSSVELQGSRDARRIIVIGRTADGVGYDLTAEAVIKPAAEIVTVDKKGFVFPRTAGETKLSVTDRKSVV